MVDSNFPPEPNSSANDSIDFWGVQKYNDTLLKTYKQCFIFIKTDSNIIQIPCIGL